MKDHKVKLVMLLYIALIKDINVENAKNCTIQ